MVVIGIIGPLTPCLHIDGSGVTSTHHLEPEPVVSSPGPEPHTVMNLPLLVKHLSSSTSFRPDSTRVCGRWFSLVRRKEEVRGMVRIGMTTVVLGPLGAGPNSVVDLPRTDSCFLASLHFFVVHIGSTGCPSPLNVYISPFLSPSFRPRSLRSHVSCWTLRVVPSSEWEEGERRG